jgi:ATP-dependent DNA helicase RecG
LAALPAARRRELLSSIADGSMQLIIGTQALIQDSIRFARLGVAVIDEQHRFGVRQRSPDSPVLATPATDSVPMFSS